MPADIVSPYVPYHPGVVSYSVCILGVSRYIKLLHLCPDQFGRWLLAHISTLVGLRSVLAASPALKCRALCILHPKVRSHPTLSEMIIDKRFQVRIYQGGILSVTSRRCSEDDYFLSRALPPSSRVGNRLIRPTVTFIAYDNSLTLTKETSI